jgi:uncharacterized membrane protein
MVELLLCLTLFVACALHVRLRLRPGPRTHVENATDANAAG